jgi:trans-2,3-dihydro-3-hydroxyanthranilate isomerase
VTKADGLTDEQMQKIAREMNLSETAFVSKPTVEGADFRLRWFTPEAEVNFCGHASIGTLYELARLREYGLGGEGKRTVKVQTMSGVLEMGSEVKDGIITASFTAPATDMQEYRLQDAEFAQFFGLPAKAIVPGGKILHNTTINDLFVPITSRGALEALQFDFNYTREQLEPEQIIAVALYAPGQDGLDVRGLAPVVGVNEDPFTGRLQAGIIRAAKAHGFIEDSQNTITTHQGWSMGRPGKATVTLDPATGTTTITGRAVHVFSTELEV